jgi:hypothetical protein
MNRSYAESKENAIKKRPGAALPKSRGGRPPKYAEPRRPITVTLPERILKSLGQIDPDRSRAIVKCVEATERQQGRPANPVELIELTAGKALITVAPSPALRRIPWLRMIEIAPLRFLLALPPGTAVEVLEVALQDLLADPDAGEQDKPLLEVLLSIIRNQRRGRQLSMGEILFVDRAGKGSRPQAPPAAP